MAMPWPCLFPVFPAIHKPWIVSVEIYGNHGLVSWLISPIIALSHISLAHGFVPCFLLTWPCAMGFSFTAFCYGCFLSRLFAMGFSFTALCRDFPHGCQPWFPLVALSHGFSHGFLPWLLLSRTCAVASWLCAMSLMANDNTGRFLWKTYSEDYIAVHWFKLIAMKEAHRQLFALLLAL